MNKNIHKILVIDGQGGGVGRMIIERIRQIYPNIEIIACGTNVIATKAMITAGADDGATGANAIIYNARRASLILGVMGILIPNSMLGEYTPDMAEAVSDSNAEKILIPMKKCNIQLAIDSDYNLTNSLEVMISLLKEKIK